MVYYKPGVKIFASISCKLYDKYCHSIQTTYTDKKDYYLFHKIFDIEIGDNIPCLACSINGIRRTNSFLCEKCVKEKNAETDFYKFCQDCGRHLWSEDEIFMVNGEIYCEHCYCNEIFGDNDYEEEC